MRDYWTCPGCEENLDHGEKCVICGCDERDDMNRKHHKHLNKYIKNMEGTNGEFNYQGQDYYGAIVYQ